MKISRKLLIMMIAVVTIVCTFALSVNATSYKDVKSGEYYTESVEKLTMYGIVSGFNGSFRPAANLTRAEFAKVTALISGLEDQVHNNVSYKKFDDVSVSHWGTGYINTVANNKLIIGYTDGTFKPEKNVTYAEAVTVVLRALDYSSTDLGDNWPLAYLAKANALGLTSGLKFNQNNSISRADLCVIIDRALETELNNSTSKLISKLDVTVTDELLLIATKTEDSSLAADEVKTDMGTYKIANSDLKIEALSKAKLVLNEDNEIIGLEEVYIPEKEITYVERLVNNEAYFANGSSAKTLGISDNTKVYYDGLITSYGAQKQSIKKDDSIAFIYDKVGNIEYVVVKDVDYTDAVTVYSDIYTALNSVGVTKTEIDNSEIFRDGYAATIDDIQKYDVAYFNRAGMTIYLYSDKISGTYNEAFPSKVNVTSIELSGNTFELETQTAANKLGEKSGSYKIGARVTLLLGKDGKVVDVIENAGTDKGAYGILISYTEGLSSDILQAGKQENIVTLINGEGKTINYKVEKDYEDIIGCIVTITTDDKGYATLNTITSSKTISGVVDKVNNKIGKYWLSSDCTIIEKISSPDSANIGVSARVVELKDFIPNELTEKNVLHVVTIGEFNDISILFVENVFNSQFQYGILENEAGSSRGTSVSGKYQVFTQGKSISYSTNFYNKITSGSAVSMIIENNQLKSIKKMYAACVLNKVEAADYTRIKTSSGVYKIGDDVQLIQKISSGYKNVAKNEIESLKGKTVSLFADSDPEKGGLIRIILLLD